MGDQWTEQRVGVPEEILTDQGTNFTSQLLSEVYRLLHIKPTRTTPYHPQTDGLAERFNGMLKAMLKKTASEEGRDQERLLLYLLFAYREVPSASTGFSPFQLWYGRNVRGPLLKESWEVSRKSTECGIIHSGDSGEACQTPRYCLGKPCERAGNMEQVV